MRSKHIILIIVSLVSFVYLFRYDYWKKDQIIRSDGYAYYGYVQGTLVHHDPYNTFHGDVSKRGRYAAWMQEGIEGRYLPKMTMGLALAWVPGFYIADVIATLFDYPKDGWSRPYQMSVALSGLFFLLLGLWSVYELLITRFSGFVSGLTVIALFAATNLLQYASVEPSMSHVYSFGLIAFFLFLCERWVQHRRFKTLILASLILGWITLIRPTNVIVGFYLPFMLYFRSGSIKPLINVRLIVLAIVALLPIIPQLFFWKGTTGNWIHYSYNDETFFWLKPYILEGLFSYRNGWLLYTPIMALALIGFVPLRRIDKGYVYASLILLVLHIYVTFSWWCWYYGGSLSIRPMIDMYALLAIPLASSIAWIFGRNKIIASVGVVALVLLTVNNIYQVDAFNAGYITGSTMTKQAFWATLFKSKPPTHLDLIAAYRDVDTDRLRLGKPERTSLDTVIVAEHGSFNYTEEELNGIATKESNFTDRVAFPLDSVLLKPKDQLELIVTVRSEDISSTDLHLVLSIDHNELNYMYRAANVSEFVDQGGQIIKVPLYFRIHPQLPEGAELGLYGWLRGDSEAEIMEASLKQIQVHYSESL